MGELTSEEMAQLEAEVERLTKKADGQLDVSRAGWLKVDDLTRRLREAENEVERLTGLVTVATVEAAKAQKERDEARGALDALALAREQERTRLESERMQAGEAQLEIGRLRGLLFETLKVIDPQEQTIGMSRTLRERIKSELGVTS